MSLATGEEPVPNARTTMHPTSERAPIPPTVSCGESRYGTAEPQIEIRFPKATSHRVVNAALHRLAAEVELATPSRERWLVQTETLANGRGRVYLELADATPAETERGLALLSALARTAAHESTHRG